MSSQMVAAFSGRNSLLPVVAETPPLRVLVVEKIPPVSDSLAEGLAGAGMSVEEIEDPAAALEAKTGFRPDVVLVCLRSPDIDGLLLIEELARDGDCGIIVLCAKAPHVTVVTGLERGADDFLMLPLQTSELVARVRALHRRLGRPPVPDGAARTPHVTLDAATRCILGPGKLRTPLTEAEFAAIETLVEADGASVSRDWLGRVALKRGISATDRSVDQLVLKLRRKLALHGMVGRVILSARGLGYVIPEPGRFHLTGSSTVY